MPHYTKADVFSNLFGNSASASNTNAQGSAIGINSQNIGLLQANVSSAKIIEDKKNKNNKDKNVIDETKEITISDENSLLPATGPTGVSNGTEDDVSSDLNIYVVREGDTVAKIAEMFNVSAITIRKANDLKVGEKLKVDDVLIILPVSGALHTVAKGETLKGLAGKYKVDISDIANFNGIAEDAPLAIGDELIIPDATMIDGGGDKPAPKNTAKDKDYYIKHPVKNLGGYFINPVPGYKYRSQGIHGKNSVDLAANSGTPILAAASGTVILARNSGYNGGYGRMVVIAHPNGTQTLYAHQSKVITHTGAQVKQGEIIGYVGTTGHSTGNHLHYEVKGARNNAIDL